MAYRETCLYVVLCDTCGLPAPEGTGWWTPSIADHAALQAGWAITTTEHLCPACSAGEGPNAEEAPPARAAGPAMTPDPHKPRPDVCWPLRLAGAGNAWGSG